MYFYSFLTTFIIHNIQHLRISSGFSNCVVPHSSGNRYYYHRSTTTFSGPLSSTRRDFFFTTRPSTKIIVVFCGEKTSEDHVEEEEEEENEKEKENNYPATFVRGSDDDSTTKNKIGGEVIRLGARKYDAEHSKPSSNRYTTRKDEYTSLEITKMGIKGDYNHYRTIALDSTIDRAISILTTDIMTSIRATYGTKFSSAEEKTIQDGDLGENILIDGVAFDYFRIGQCYEFITPILENNKQSQNDEVNDESHQNQQQQQQQHHVVVIEITEPMTPCANLCKLPYINDETIKPMDRIERCQDFLTYLGRYDGYRGWYGKVHMEGTIGIGATVSISPHTT